MDIEGWVLNKDRRFFGQSEGNPYLYPEKTYLMKRILIALAFVAILSGCGRKEVLFNGKDLDGWVCITKADSTIVLDDTLAPPPTFSVMDGVLHITGEPFGYIRTEKKYADYTLHVEWRWAEKRVDSGIFNRLQDPDKVWPTGVQLQLREKDFGFLFSGLPLKGIEGPFFRKPGMAETDPELADGEWNVTEITCKGSRMTFRVNGVLVNEADCEATEGYIGFQSEGGPIEFRNIWLR